MKRQWIQTYPSNQFGWSNGTGVAEVSGLGNIFDQIYDDACDVGFNVSSERTGKVITFFHSTTDKRDGEITGWNFISECKNFKILVIND